MPSSPIVELCGVRTEHCPPGTHTGEQISPPGCYVGGGLEMQTDLGIDPAGNVWVMNNWEAAALERRARAGHRQLYRHSQGGAIDALRRARRRDLLRYGEAGACSADRTSEAVLVHTPHNRSSRRAGGQRRNWIILREWSDFLACRYSFFCLRPRGRSRSRASPLRISLQRSPVSAGCL